MSDGFNDNSILAIIILAVALAAIPIITIVGFLSSKNRKTIQKKIDGRFSVAFFHPYCNAGGGGERVLWCGIKYLQQRNPNFRYVVYTGDGDSTPKEILSNVKSRFNIDLKWDSVEFIFLRRRDWVEAHHYKYLTLFRQSLGSIVLGLEALKDFVPDVFIDTMGYAFTLPIFKVLGRCRVGAYVHYPTISTDMLDRVVNRIEAHNNNSAVASSQLFTTLKIIYYRLFALLYGTVGRYSDVTMVNSSWTYNHINFLWQLPMENIYKIFPPCDVEEFTKIPLEDFRDKNLIRIVSVAQFRPEKDHQLQLKAMVEVRKLVDADVWGKIRLVLIGGCRNIEDRCRVAHLKYLATQMDLEQNVEFLLNLPFEDLKSQMSQGIIGIHTMWNEHFGIGIVECMAAGLITVAHNSGGPMMDIVHTKDPSRTGFLAVSEQEYAESICQIIRMNPDDRRTIQLNARSSVDRFSEIEFGRKFLNATKEILGSS